MTFLQDRFGSADLVAIAIGLLSVVEVMLLFIWQNRLDSNKVAMQVRFMAIEEARFIQELARAVKADIRVTLRSSPKERSRVKNFHLFLENKGDAAAQNVMMDIILSVPAGPAVPNICSAVFTVATLRSEDKVNCTVNLFGGHGPSFDVDVSWTDARGRVTETQRVTLDP